MDREGEIIDSYAVKVFRYKSLGITRGLGMIGQPEPQFYFNRTISALYKICFEAVFVIDGIEEPTFEASVEPSRSFSWANFHEIPPVMITRARPS